MLTNDPMTTLTTHHSFFGNLIAARSPVKRNHYDGIIFNQPGSE